MSSILSIPALEGVPITPVQRFQRNPPSVQLSAEPSKVQQLEENGKTFHLQQQHFPFQRRVMWMGLTAPLFQVSFYEI